MNFFENAAVLVVQNPQPDFEFGVDLITWQTGPQFKGLKMIPPGVHSIHYNLMEEKGGIRTTLFVEFQQRQTVVARWNSKEERLEVTDGDANRWELDKFLGPYPFADKLYGRWQGLSGKVSWDLIDQTNTQMFSPMDDLVFTEVDPKQSIPPQTDPSRVMKFSQDKTWLLEKTMTTPQELVGEFQLVFLVTLVGNNLGGLEQWKHLVELVLGCQRILEDSRMVDELIVPFLRALKNQLEECPMELGQLMVENEETTVLSCMLKKFGLAVYESSSQEKLGGVKDELKVVGEVLWRRFGWELPDGRELQKEADEEEGEYEPQIVFM